MKRYDWISPKTLTSTIALMFLSSFVFGEDTLPNRIEVAKCTTQKSDWPVILGWDNGELVPKKIILEIYQTDPKKLSGGHLHSGFDPRLSFDLQMNDSDDAGDYFPEEGYLYLSGRAFARLTDTPRTRTLHLTSKMSHAILKFQKLPESSNSFEIELSTQSVKDQTYYYRSVLACENL